jgi:PHP family Zn ribbon phosphoesterase
MEGIMRVRTGNVNIVPGYDGEYGKVSIFSGDSQFEKTRTPETKEPEQSSLF